jgi:hypothetical protein
MNKRLVSLILLQSLIALAAGHVEAQSLPVPIPQTTLVPITNDSYPLGAADHLNIPEDLNRVGYLVRRLICSWHMAAGQLAVLQGGSDEHI